MKTTQGLIVGLALWAAAGACHAQGLTPEVFVQADVAAREITLQHMADRLAALQAGMTLDEEMAALTASEQAVADIFASYGTTANLHAAYAAQHGLEIEAWLEANPAWQAHLLDLQTQFFDLSQEFDAIRGGNP